ncbi:isochorismatase hydrolase [Ophiostoma piceae UAMH 11346]|uniref:Isochorismatase hydrolase n=1 Tax=Ophiostoma piceae (strain UAMH 11346) TaxID=1262450 RepID=S3C9R8_OPHP1|nr:isochorismatase hydrolase [Ophiostoma piceae UAMH 11346]
MATLDGDVLHMGPVGDQWQYQRLEKTYDLTRPGQGNESSERTRPLTIRTTGGPQDTQVAIDPRRTALVIVDMQNFFLHPRCRDHPTGLAAVAPTLSVIDGCRRAGIQVVWLNWGLTETDLATMPAAIVTGFARSMILGGPANQAPVPRGLGVNLGGSSGRMLTKGAWNSEVYGGGVPEGVPSLAAAVRPDLGDVQCDKTRMSGMWSPQEPLRQYLETTEVGRNIQTLLFTGVNTDQCVLGTLADAYNNGWDCVAIEDCCATTTPGGQSTTLANVANCYGFVVDSTTFTEAVASFCSKA